MTGRQDKDKRKGMAFIGLGAELALLIISALFGGQWVDAQLGTGGLAVAGLTLGALLVWIFHLARMLKRNPF